MQVPTITCPHCGQEVSASYYDDGETSRDMYIEFPRYCPAEECGELLQEYEEEDMENDYN